MPSDVESSRLRLPRLQIRTGRPTGTAKADVHRAAATMLDQLERPGGSHR